jgi:hypothetical protein
VCSNFAGDDAAAVPAVDLSTIVHEKANAGTGFGTVGAVSDAAEKI